MLIIMNEQFNYSYSTLDCSLCQEARAKSANLVTYSILLVKLWPVCCGRLYRCYLSVLSMEKRGIENEHEMQESVCVC